MKRALAAAGLVAASVAVRAQAQAPPHWSFAAPLGGFDLGAAQRGFGVYEQHCASCHSMKQLAPSDLLGLGFDAHAANGVLRRLGRPPFAGGGGAGPDLSRAVRVAGPDAIWRIVVAPGDSVDSKALPPGHPVLKRPDEARDLVTFLAFAAFPHQTLRRQVGVAVLLFGLVALGLGTRAARRNRHG